jgi:hypothetical protein
MTFELSKLPDLPALQQLARALWHNGSIRGAALFVGAGFSKNAILQAPDTPKAPDWNELLTELVDQLYPSDKRSAPRDALRIAEEYRIYFGPSALDGFIRARFPDRAWLPGSLHLQALKFPWSDILTTNWDTILERTADDLTDINYEVIRTEADLVHARSPRIIKLHGTLGDKDPLIFTAEDYRTYPVRRAAFVNLARQIFIENDLCLLGFSGNDPNFLEWAGWVRDQLGSHARRIYLAGNLDLSAPTRRYLESLNISPIDFAPMVSHLPRKERHSAATKSFLDALHAEQPAAPHEWKQHSLNEYPLHKGGHDLFEKARKDESFAVEALKETAQLLRDDREKYPGWLVCPRVERHRRNYEVASWIFFRPSVLARIEPVERAQILAEFLWCYVIRLMDLDVMLRDAIVALMEEASPPIERGPRLKFAVALMRDARLERHDGNFEKWSTLIDSEVNADDAERLEANYQRCLRLRDQLNLVELGKLVSELESENPIWRLRQAGIYAEVGEYEKATKLIKHATADFEKAYRLDRNSMWIKSCLAWASLLSHATDLGNFRRRGEPVRIREFQKFRIDPDSELDSLKNQADKLRSKEEDEAIAVTPLFDAGSYRQGKPKIPAQPSVEGFGCLVALDQLMELTGVPLRINHVEIAAGAAKSIMKVTFQHDARWYALLLRAMHSHFDKSFDCYFSRVAIAQLSQDVADQVRRKLDDSITFWSRRCAISIGEERDKDRSVAIDELRLALTAQSRMTVRMTVDQALEAFQCGAKIVRDSSILHPWIIDAACDLAKYALEAIPSERRSSIAFEVIQFPLDCERGGHPTGRPDLIGVIDAVKPERDWQDLRWDQRIRELLDMAAPDAIGRAEAINCLAYLSKHGTLKPDEHEAFAEVLWSKLDEGTPPLPADTMLLASAYVSLPAPTGVDPIALVKSRIFDRDLEQVMNYAGPLDTRVISEKQRHLISFYNTAPLKLFMAESRAQELFDQIVKWTECECSPRDPVGSEFIQGFNTFIRQIAGDILSFVLVPAMSNEAKNEERLLALLSFLSQSKCWSSVRALPNFIETVPTMEEPVIMAIHRGLSADQHPMITGAAAALVRWSELHETKALPSVPRKLIEKLLSMIEANKDEGLHILLNAATSLTDKEITTKEDMARLKQTLNDLRDVWEYSDVLIDSRRAVTISLVRQQAVRLAGVLRKKIPDDGTLEGWLQEGRLDPLPEVRFAVEPG